MKKSKHTEKLKMRDITCHVGCGCGRASQMQTRILAGRMRTRKGNFNDNLWFSRKGTDLSRHKNKQTNKQIIIK